MPIEIMIASVDDAEEILALQKRAYESEARFYDDWSIPPMTQTIEELRAEFPRFVALKAVADNAIVGSVRGATEDGVCAVGRLMVEPAWQGQGIGSRLLSAIEVHFPDADAFELFTGTRSERSIRLYRRQGYVETRATDGFGHTALVYMRKPHEKR